MLGAGIPHICMGNMINDRGHWLIKSPNNYFCSELLHRWEVAMEKAVVILTTWGGAGQSH